MAAHRQSRKSPRAWFGGDLVAALNQGEDVFRQLATKRRRISRTILAKARCPRWQRVCVHHDHHHRHRFLAGEQRVHDPVGLAVNGPGPLVVAVAVSQVKHRQTCRGSRPRRRVDDDAPPLVERFRFIGMLVKDAVRNVLQIPEGGRICREMQDADSRPALRFDGGILRVDGAQPIDYKTVFMDAGGHGRHGHGPQALIVLGHQGVRPELPRHFHLLGLRCLQAERDAAVRQNLWGEDGRRSISASRRHVGGGFGLLGLARGRGSHERQEDEWDEMVFHEGLRTTWPRSNCPSSKYCPSFNGPR